MKTGDYSTKRKAYEYYSNRFLGGLKYVSWDEASIINNWIDKYSHKGNTYLDLGTGTGRAIKEILKNSPGKVYGLDQSKEMLYVLRENIYRSSY